VLAKHTKNFSILNAMSVGVDDMMRNFKPMVEAVERWRDSQLTRRCRRLFIYRAFIEGELEVPRDLDRRVHDLYFNPTHEEFSRAHCEPFQCLHFRVQGNWNPIPQYRATAKLAGFLGAAMSARFPPGQIVATPAFCGALRKLGSLSPTSRGISPATGATSTRRTGQENETVPRPWVPAPVRVQPSKRHAGLWIITEPTDPQLRSFFRGVLKPTTPLLGSGFFL